MTWRRLPLVHSWRAGQGMQALFGQDTTMASPCLAETGLTLGPDETDIMN